MRTETRSPATQPAGARRLHRGLAWSALAAALLWASSGVLHITMTWTQPRAVQNAAPAAQGVEVPPGIVPAALVSANASAAHGTVRGGRVLAVDGRAHLQLLPDAADRHFWLPLSDGQPRALEPGRAEALARHFTGDQRPVSVLEPVSAFSDAYPSINRLLPVWRVRFEGPEGLTAYVDTGLDRLATLDDRANRVQQGLFRNAHTLVWITWEPLRVTLIALLVGTLLLTALLGGALLLRGRARLRPRRRHRALAAAAVLPLLMFAASGVAHLLVHAGGRGEAVQAPPAVPLSSLQAQVPPGTHDTLALVPTGGRAYWRSEYAGGVRVFDASGGEAVDGGDAWLATEIARGFGARAPRATAELKRFGDGYGFENKRLPVWRVEHEDGVWFIETRTGWLARRLGTAQRLEQPVFAALHKWQFLNPLGIPLRDALMFAAAALLAGVAVSGARLRRRARSAPAATGDDSSAKATAGAE